MTTVTSYAPPHGPRLLAGWADTARVADLVEALMGRKPELRFRFIQENAEFAAADLDV